MRVAKVLVCNFHSVKVNLTCLSQKPYFVELSSITLQSSQGVGEPLSQNPVPKSTLQNVIDSLSFDTNEVKKE